MLCSSYALSLQAGPSSMFDWLNYSLCSHSIRVGAGRACVCDAVDTSCVAIPVPLVLVWCVLEAMMLGYAMHTRFMVNNNKPTKHVVLPCFSPCLPWGLTADKAPHSSGSSRPGSLTRG
jgi:hypothetical protein